MTRRILQLAVACVLLCATLTPLANLFDTWDKAQPPACDTELQVASWFVGAGLVMVVVSLLRYRPVLAPSQLHSGTRPQASPAMGSSAGELPQPTASPPLVPLRI